ncbi:MAG: protein-L-isoaspartate(D-aspartate) O-methyltransferase [Steroidobacteraceae bacterium]|jgi:protein-L-isoaspartate(D-aspartate) O-methyltransferase|nr:protein-L-isoaspartate(D-aspartate) O-methyltransferase [Steroidobacteraceae bacterium]MBP9129054.1 protein-L-isoaspartate(D-aspartate) O-methyltransferase [Steroidobacteraceae bacterium]
MTSARTRERLVARLREQGITDNEVLERIRSVPRHMFVDEALASRAYEDTALPIGHGQTISQPYIVARMTQSLLEARKPRKVLEVGTGCGYQTAVLAPLAATLYSVERIAALQVKARQILRDLRIANVYMKHGDGFEGWAAYAPFDGIIVAAAAYAVPPALLEQLADGGRLVIPVGNDREQQLLRITRRGDRYEREVLGPVIFVPLLQGLA